LALRQCVEAVIKGQVYFWAIGAHKKAPAGDWCLFAVICFFGLCNGQLSTGIAGFQGL